jgi:uncharacterized membrane protein YdjX (TVP38/TMEM64 family)
MPGAVRPAVSSVPAWRAALREMGPLRWVALASAVLPTAGLFAVLAHRRELAAVWPPGLAGVALAIAVIAATTGAMLLPPGFAAFAAGYVLGTAAGAACAAVGTALGALLSLLLWPLLGERFHAFVRPRPRVVAVRDRCAGAPLAVAAWRVAALRCAAKLPFAVTNLLLSAARVRAAAVAVGSLLGALPGAAVAAGAGTIVRGLDERRGWPGAPGIAALAAAAALAVWCAIAARRTLPRSERG